MDGTWWVNHVKWSSAQQQGRHTFDGVIDSEGLCTFLLPDRPRVQAKKAGQRLRALQQCLRAGAKQIPAAGASFRSQE